MGRREERKKTRTIQRKVYFVCEEGQCVRNCENSENRDQRCFCYKKHGHRIRWCPKRQEEMKCWNVGRNDVGRMIVKERNTLIEEKMVSRTAKIRTEGHMWCC